MDICEEIALRRSVGMVRCGIRPIAFGASVTEVASHFDLLPDFRCYNEIDATVAEAILVRILHRDLAYGVVVMPQELARSLAARFLDAASSPSCRCFSNGDFSQASPAAWMPATTATFDTGVLIVGPGRSACFWVEDED
jgi:hypothetical protein